MKWHEPTEQPTTRWVTRDAAQERIGQLEKELAVANMEKGLVQALKLSTTLMDGFQKAEGLVSENMRLKRELAECQKKLDGYVL